MKPATPAISPTTPATPATSACDDWRDAARNAHDDPDRDAVRAAYAAYEVALDADQVAHDDQVLTARAAYDARESVYAAKRAF